MAKPDEIEEQEIKENRLLEDLTFVKDHVRKWFVDNVFKRTLAHLVGWTGTHSVMLKCLSDGTLKTTTQATGKTVGSYGVVSVGNTATLIRASNTDRIAIAIKNQGTTDIYVGFDNLVTTANGWRIEPGGGESFDYWLGTIYAIVAAGTEDMAYQDI